ncbi:MAG TPA: response regulator [Candidatus Methanoperedens sp.]
MVNEKILVVEDEGIIAMHIQNSLINLGYSVSGLASSGEEAIEMAKNYQPDLVLMDIVLAGKMDGIEAADHIRNNYNMPVIYLTAHGDKSTFHRAKITEPYGYLLKPFKERELHIAIEIALYKYGIEARLKAIDGLLTTILQSIGDAIITTDIKGFIIFLNSVAATLTGWDQEEAEGKNLTDVFNIADDQTNKPIENPVTRINQDGIDHSLPPDTILISRDGNKIPIDGNGAPLRDEKGVVKGAIFIFRDNTERKRAKDEIKKLNAELEKRVFERTEELTTKNKELEIMIKGLVGRELKMVELKKMIHELEDKTLEKDQ